MTERGSTGERSVGAIGEVRSWVVQQGKFAATTREDEWTGLVGPRR
jgi:hypothetical protein